MQNFYMFYDINRVEGMMGEGNRPMVDSQNSESFGIKSKCARHLTMSDALLLSLPHHTVNSWCVIAAVVRLP